MPFLSLGVSSSSAEVFGTSLGERERSYSMLDSVIVRHTGGFVIYTERFSPTPTYLCPSGCLDDSVA